ncbi:uncharacterized protein LOC144442362 [Glandiceps talaboti]
MDDPPPPYPGTGYQTPYQQQPPYNPHPGQHSYPSQQPPYNPHPGQHSYPSEQPPYNPDPGQQSYPSQQPYHAPAFQPYSSTDQQPYSSTDQQPKAYPPPGQQPYQQQPYGQPPPGPYPQQQGDGGEMHIHSQQNTVVVTQSQAQTANVVTVAEPEVNDCCTDCEFCGDNACGQCCRACWECDKYHKWYSLNGKGPGWILFMLLFYLIAGTIGLVISIFILVILCFVFGGGD